LEGEAVRTFDGGGDDPCVALVAEWLEKKVIRVARRNQQTIV
jgi:hypothetical protein